MNWDWEKLQEKRQRQGGSPPPQGDGPGNLFDGFQLGKYLPKKLGSGLPVGPVVIVLLLLWLASGIFIVDPGEVGVVTRFGKAEREVGPGPNYRLPFPIESVSIVNTQILRTVVVGQPLEPGSRQMGNAPTISNNSGNEESSMFTQDENIVNMQFTVQYNISSASDFLFKVKNPSQVVAQAAEAAMREVVGSAKIDAILTDGRLAIQEKARQALSETLTEYGIGVNVHLVRIDGRPPAEVDAAFKDVFSAREDRQQIINLAEAYRAEIVPVAEGQAASMRNAAEAYRIEVEEKARGEASRFLAMVEQYNKAKDVTRKRLYLEAMADMLSGAGMEKIIISKDAKGNVLPLLTIGGAADAQPAPRTDVAPKGGTK